MPNLQPGDEVQLLVSLSQTHTVQQNGGLFSTNREESVCSRMSEDSPLLIKVLA